MDDFKETMKTELSHEAETAVAIDVLPGEDNITGQSDNEQVCCAAYQISPNTGDTIT